ncbi:hypothetical protein L210DRAFT_984032 [Boletus edulis BED1]|uniref:Uncharacterized protein n=1 Tax=Boletus edulis BED1 TaxID=1328754 RepID=A0AAD4GLZ0_BOLED|nr:hypothetical protein L210DRAFT_984032 [Boletus edulis BED1]
MYGGGYDPCLKDNIRTLSGERADSLERELHQAKAQIKSEVSAWWILEQQNLELAQDVEGQC